MWDILEEKIYRTGFVEFGVRGVWRRGFVGLRFLRGRKEGWFRMGF